MSDIMLICSLRMPMPDEPAEVDTLMWHQLRGRIQEAATRIERDADEIEHLRADLREEQDRRQAMRNEWGAEVAALTAQARHAEDCLEAAKARISALDVELVQEKFAHMGQAALESLVATQRMRIAKLETELERAEQWNRDRS